MFSIQIFSIKWRNLFALPLAFPFGSPCRIAVLRQARQVEWRVAPREDKLKSKTSFKPSPCLHKIASAMRLPLAYWKFCLQNFLRQKCSTTSWLPLASSCLRTMRQKLSALFQGFPSGGSCQQSWLMRGSFKFDIIFYNRKQATPLIRFLSATPSRQNYL